MVHLRSSNALPWSPFRFNSPPKGNGARPAGHWS